MGILELRSEDGNFLPVEKPLVSLYQEYPLISKSESILSLHQPEKLKASNITHVVSVVTGSLQDVAGRGYERLQVDVDDMPEVDLMEHFATTNAFIEKGLHSGGGVLIHW